MGPADYAALARPVPPRSAPACSMAADGAQQRRQGDQHTYRLKADDNYVEPHLTLPLARLVLFVSLCIPL